MFLTQLENGQFQVIETFRQITVYTNTLSTLRTSAKEEDIQFKMVMQPVAKYRGNIVSPPPFVRMLFTWTASDGVEDLTRLEYLAYVPNVYLLLLPRFTDEPGFGLLANRGGEGEFTEKEIYESELVLKYETFDYVSGGVEVLDVPVGFKIINTRYDDNYLQHLN